MSDRFFNNLDMRSRDWLNSLLTSECKELQSWLKKRIKYLKQIPLVERKIEELKLSTRAYYALKKHGLHKVADVAAFGLENIWMIKHIGPKTAEEIKMAILI